MGINIFISLSWNFIVSPSTSSALKCLSDFLDFANFILFTLMSNSELKSNNIGSERCPLDLQMRVRKLRGQRVPYVEVREVTG